MCTTNHPILVPRSDLYLHRAQIGFGEAGASIVEKNMKLTRGEEVEPLVPGRRIMAIFGFCDVRNFTVATECLQEG